MHQTHETSSIVQQTSPRSDLLIFEIRAKITKNDIESMARRVDQAFDVEEKIDLLLVMTNYEGADLGAVFDGDAGAVMVRSLAHVRRYGVVGAPGWARAMIEFFKWVTPVQEKTFSLDQLTEARAWIDSA